MWLVVPVEWLLVQRRSWNVYVPEVSRQYGFQKRKGIGRSLFNGKLPAGKHKTTLLYADKHISIFHPVCRRDVISGRDQLYFFRNRYQVQLLPCWREYYDF